MKVLVDLICWNEEYLLPYTLHHYKRIADHIRVFDNHSTDRSVEIAKHYRCEIIPFGSSGVLDDREYLKIKNSNVHGYDWRIVCDSDEILMLTRSDLETENSTVLNVEGFNIYSNENPSLDILDIKTGFYDPNFSKSVCYNPKEISTMCYQWGAHTCKPIGNIIRSSRKYILRHYRCIGGVERMINRHRMYKEMMSDFNKSNGLGVHYLRTEQQIRDEFKVNLMKSLTSS